MLNPILNALTQHLAQHSLVFWHDTDQQADMALLMSLPKDINVIRIDEVPALAVKQQFHQETHQQAQKHHQQNWLFYSNQAEPSPEEDWLLNIRLQAKTFYADTASLQMETLGLCNLAMRDHLKKREKFLRAKERQHKLARLTYATDNEQTLDLNMLTVLAGAEQADLTAIVLRGIEQFHRQLCTTEAEQITAQPAMLEEFSAYGLTEVFWQLMQQHYGYDNEQPNFMDFIVKLLTTDFISTLSAQTTPPRRLSVHLLKHPQQRSSAVVFVSQWRNHISLTTAYHDLSAKVAELLQLEPLLAELSLTSLSRCYTFLIIEKRMIAQLRDLLLNEHPDTATIEKTISDRQAGYWVAIASQHSEDPEYAAYPASYTALMAALSYQQLHRRYASGFSFLSAKQAVSTYCQELYRFDQWYRIYQHAVFLTQTAGWSVFNSLTETIETAYTGHFFPHLTTAWAKVLEGKQGLLANWQIEGLQAQQYFYRDKVTPYFKQGVKRVFVIISDALRYEVGEALVKQLKAKNRYKAELTAMLSVLPSYTSLGMAALLPHQTLSYTRTTHALGVRVDDMPTDSLEYRHDILARHQGVAIKASSLINQGKQNGREFVRDAKVVYVYHDRIDMLGDKQGTELETFSAVEQTLQELNNLSAFLINNLNAGTVLITADHGFIYQQSEMTAHNRVEVSPPTTSIIQKKRYLIGEVFPAEPRVWAGNTAITAHTEVGAGSMDFWLPKGAGRFHFSGGARFVHGGAMPQEVIIPLIEIKVTEHEKDKVRTVSFSQIGMNTRVTSNRQRFEFLQNEPVTDKVQAIQVIVSLQDGDQSISDEQIIYFSSTSNCIDDRRFSIYLTVKAGQYDPHRDYDLVTYNAINKYELSRIPIRIAIAFNNDF